MASMAIKPKLNLLFDRSGEKSTKYLINIYKVYHILMGLDFGFVKFKSFKVTIVSKLFALAQCLLFCYLCSGDTKLFDNIYVFFWFTIFLFQYVTYVSLLLLFKRDTNFANFLLDLDVIDIVLKSHRLYCLQSKILLAVLFSFLYRLLVIVSYCAYTGYCRLNVSRIFLYILMLHASDVALITQVFVFYSLSCRLNELISILETMDCHFLSMQHIYKLIVDVAEKYKAAFERLYLAALLLNVPLTMAPIYFTILEILRSKKWSVSMTLWANYGIVLAALSLTCAPALCAGVLASQAGKLKVLLHDKVLQQQDKNEIRDLKRFIWYVEARGCKFRVYKVLPLDADLLGMVLGFCATYLIVIIQFMNQKE